MAVGNKIKLRNRLDQLAGLAGRSSRPFVQATRLFCHALSLEKCTTWETGLSANEKDDWRNIFGSFQESSKLFLAENEINMAIWCQLEYAHSKIALGEYITAIDWIERTLTLAKDHQAWKWTGRMLQVASSAATDQGYRKGVESTIRKSITWCEFVGDVWGRIEAETALGRLLMFDIPPRDLKQAAVPEECLRRASQDAENAGIPWLHRRAENARQFLRTKTGVNDSSNAPSPESRPDNLDNIIRRRIASRLEDGISDSPNAFFVFSAIRDEQAVCRDLLNEYRNLAGVKVLDKGLGYVALFSEVSDNPYMVGLQNPIREATDLRRMYDDVVEIQSEQGHFWIHRRLVPSGDGAVLTLRDVTAEREVETALRKAADTAIRSERSMLEFLANMSHEIRTPINGVLGLARMLSETNLDDVQRAYVKDIIGSGDILFGLIGDILDISKIEAGFIDIVPEPVDLRELVSGIAGLYRGQATEKGVAVEFRLGPEVPEVVRADGVRLRQVLANLVGNAVKFTQSGNVTISVSTERHEIVFEVSDTGIGIALDQLESIFNPFQQAANIPGVQSGTGLGLTISKRLVELMGGSIEVYSTPGEGSRFVVRLALERIEKPIQAAITDLPADFKGLRVLLVEDNEVNMIVSEHFLRRLGCEVTCAIDGQKAVEITRDQKFEVVFMDVRMPVLDGLAATREIRSREAGSGQRLPIIALTAGAMAEERESCFAAGMDDYVSKPFTDDPLRTVLAKWGRKR